MSAVDGDPGLRTVGVVRSPFRERFGIPRQPGLAASARGVLEIDPSLPPECLRGLEEFSHVWLIWRLDERLPDGAATVRPPRLGGERRLGVFATRSPLRPNPVGLSLVRLEGVEAEARPPRLLLSGLDLRDGTVVFDVKPYLDWADAPREPRCGFAAERPRARLRVRFEPDAERVLGGREALRALVEEVLALDPRPAARARGGAGRRHGIRLEDLDVRFVVEGELARVVEIVSLGAGGEA